MNQFDEKLLEATSALKSAGMLLSRVETLLSACRKVNNKGIEPEVSIVFYDDLLHAWFDFCDHYVDAGFMVHQIREGE